MADKGTTEKVSLAVSHIIIFASNITTRSQPATTLFSMYAVVAIVDLKRNVSAFFYSCVTRFNVFNMEKKFESFFYYKNVSR